MKPTKKEVADAKKQAKKAEKKIEDTRVNQLQETIEEIQKNLDFINAKLYRIMDRMGLE
jgi:uncharacterized FlaG/YvyC family protein